MVGRKNHPAFLRYVLGAPEFHGHPQLTDQGFNKVQPVQMPDIGHHPVDIIFMHNPLNVSEHKSGQPPQQPRVFTSYNVPDDDVFIVVFQFCPSAMQSAAKSMKSSCIVISWKK